MTVGQLRKLIKGLPSRMHILMDMGDGELKSLCGENSDIAEVTMMDEEGNEDSVETVDILLLIPCNHVCEMEEGEINSQPELN